MEGVVSGIASYGNCFGVPNLGGETKFEPCYSGNPLVNAFALGLVQKTRSSTRKAAGEGNPVIYVGAKTGRDGIHGATMASEEFSEGSEAEASQRAGRRSVPGKAAARSLPRSHADRRVVGIQDMGAAGLTCSTCEMGARGGVGIEIELDRVPQRETGMTPYEIMLSESQERMLLVARKGPRARSLPRLRKVGARRRRSRHGHPTTSCACSSTAKSSPKFRTSAHRRSSGLQAADGALGAAGSARDAGRIQLGAKPRSHCRSQAAARQPEHLLQALGLRAVRPHGADQHRRSGPARAKLA